MQVSYLHRYGPTYVHYMHYITLYTLHYITANYIHAHIHRYHSYHRPIQASDTSVHTSIQYIHGIVDRVAIKLRTEFLFQKDWATGPLMAGDGTEHFCGGGFFSSSSFIHYDFGAWEAKVDSKTDRLRTWSQLWAMRPTRVFPQVSWF